MPDPDAVFFTSYKGPKGEKLDPQTYNKQPSGIAGLGAAGIAKGTTKETIYNDGRVTRESYDGASWGPPVAQPKNAQIANDYIAKVSAAARSGAATAQDIASTASLNAKAGGLYEAQGKLASAQAGEEEAKLAYRQQHGGKSLPEIIAEWNAVQEYAKNELAKGTLSLEQAKAYISQEHQNFTNAMAVTSANLEKARISSSERNADQNAGLDRARIASGERATDMGMATDIARQTGENVRGMLPYMATPGQAKYRSALIDHMMKSGQADQGPMPAMPEQEAPLFDPQTLAHQAAMQVLGSKYGRGGQSGTAFSLPAATALPTPPQPTNLGAINIPTPPNLQAIPNPGQAPTGFNPAQAFGGPGQPPPTPQELRAAGVPGSGLMMTPNGPQPIIMGPGYGQMPGAAPYPYQS
jgi:hypothetical protein